MKPTSLDQAFDDLSLTTEARKVLNDYLNRLQKETSSIPAAGQQELVRDIKEHLYNALEARLRKNKSKNDTLDAQIVLEVLSALGEPADYLESTQTDTGVRGISPPRRLRRSREGRVLGGVAAGIANYFRVDVVLVRVLMIALVATGVSIVLYPLLWIFIPEESASESAVSAATVPISTAPVRIPTWIGRVALVLLKISVTILLLSLYLPVLLVLTVLSIAGLALPFVWLNGSLTVGGINPFAVLGFLFPVAALCVGIISLLLLLLTVGFISRLHFRRTLFRSNSTRYLSATILTGVCVLLSIGIYTAANNAFSRSITRSYSYEIGPQFGLSIDDSSLPTEITLIGDENTTEIQLTEIRTARGISARSAEQHAEHVSTSQIWANDEHLTLTASSSRLKNYHEKIEYRLVVPADILLDISNSLGATTIKNLNTQSLTVENKMGSLEVEDSWAEQTSIRNRMGSIEISNFRPQTFPLSTPLSDNAGEVAGSHLTVICDLGSIEMTEVEVDQAEIEGRLGGIEIRHSAFAGNLASNLGSISLLEHQGVVKIQNDLGSIEASFASMQEGEIYELRSDLGSIDLNLPPGLDPRIETDRDMGNYDNRYHARRGAPQVDIYLHSSLGSISIR